MNLPLSSPSSDLKPSKSEVLFLQDVYFSMIELINQSCKKSLLDMGLYHFNKPGKMIRSKIIYQLGLSYEVPLEHLLKWSMACELLHEASLIHDDLQDGDEIRRDQKSIWSKYGMAQAINLGDFLLMLSYKPLESLSSRLTKLHTLTSLRLVQGQANEFDMNSTNEPAMLDLETNKQSHECPVSHARAKSLTESITDEYLQCIRGKTGALFSSLATGVSYLASTGEFERNYLDHIFSDLGVIFQIQDDLLDLFGDKQRGLKGSDIQEGKCSALVSIHYDSHPEDRAYINSVLCKPRKDTTKNDIESIKTIFLEKGTLKKCISFLKLKISELEHDMQKLNDPSYNLTITNNVNDFVKQILIPIEHIYNQNKHNFSPSITDPKNRSENLNL